VKLTLKDFQDEAVEKLIRFAGRARAEALEGDTQALVLAAPTGSGKTVIATRWMERLVDGDETHAPDPKATFLWITDQPELNEQTRRKMLHGSTVFGPDDLLTIDSGFDSEMFEAGKVYFLNTQKLAKTAGLVKRGDKRTNLIWETITNTEADRPGSFWIVIDEAHKGMSENRSQRDEAKTTIQKFIKGSDGELPAMPLIFGVSATPERFNKLIEGTPRVPRPVIVSPEDVRSSGLLKDAITLYHPAESQPSDLTLLRDAAERLKAYDEEWAGYSEREQAPDVKPILVVQVEDAAANSDKASKTDIAEAITLIEDVLGPLDKYAVAHSFERHLPEPVSDDRTVRYVAPSDIQDDPDLRVVFFKRSLTTGWDCPRAEVMMSYRRAVDQTLIAQLVGRMVRTPLARAVSGSDFLNSVCLYLPYYDGEALDATIEYLTDPDPDIGFPTRVQRGESLVVLPRNKDLDEVFDAAAKLKTYRVEKVKKQSNVRRLLRLGRLLAWDKIDADAAGRYANALVGELDAYREKVADDEEFMERLKQAALITMRGVTVGYGETTPTSVETTELTALVQNVDGAFAQAGRKLGGGLHLAYLRSRAGQDDAPAPSAIRSRRRLASWSPPISRPSRRRLAACPTRSASATASCAGRPPSRSLSPGSYSRQSRSPRTATSTSATSTHATTGSSPPSSTSGSARCSRPSCRTRT
jgi:type III restriction enzyme